MTRKTPKISIVCAWYQRADVIDLTLQSVLSQDFDDYEVILVNDGSPDPRVRERIDAHADPRLRVIHQANTGFVDAIRRAIEQSRGDYIAVQGSGDVSHPNRIREQAAILDARPEVGVVGSWFHSVSDDGARLPRKPNANDTTFETLVRSNVFTHGEVMYRRSVYNDAGGYRSEFKFAQDIDLWLRAIRLCRFATVPMFLYDRYVRGDGVSYDADKRIEQIKLSILASRLAKASDDDEREALRKVRETGVNGVIPNSDPEFQRKLRKAIIRFSAWGNFAPAKKLNQYIQSRRSKLAHTVLVGGMELVASTSTGKRILDRVRSVAAK
jgi:glycosyltransferase involved in cell wall biosynthesis